MSDVVGNSATRWRVAGGRQAAALVWSFLAPFVGLLLVVLIFVAYQQAFKPDNPFLSSYRLSLIAKQTAIVGMGALGMTVIIISGGIDLSAGSMLALTSVVLALSLKQDVAPVMAVGLVLLTGAAAGFLNGVLITTLRLVPFIVTLGTMLVFRGLAEWVSDQKKIQAPDALHGCRRCWTPSPDGWQFVPGVCGWLWFWAWYWHWCCARVGRYVLRWVRTKPRHDYAAFMCRRLSWRCMPQGGCLWPWPGYSTSTT